jgi:hypothetical protein
VEKHLLEIVNRHLLVHLDGGLALVDTGSPFDIGRGRAFTVLGRTWEPSATPSQVLGLASDHLGRDVEWLLGQGVLSAYRLLLDWPRGVAAFSTSAIEHAGATSVPIKLDKGVPLLGLRHGDASVEAVLDSGAALSYVPPAAVVGIPPERTERDFYPVFGHFETDVWRITVLVGVRLLEVEVGTLPDPLQGMLGRVSAGWILGSDFFRGRAVVLDYPGRRVIDAPDGDGYAEAG